MGYPEDYKCSKCGKQGFKLWRGYNELHVTLTCVNCTEGKRHYHSDQIGWNVPAVPVDNTSLEIDKSITTGTESIYWGYTSVPEERAEWWRKLPCMDLDGNHIVVPFAKTQEN